MTELTDHQKKQNLLFLSLPFISIFLFALCYKLFFSTLKFFILFGLLSVLTNMIIFFFYYFKNRRKLAEENIDNLSFIVKILTLIVPFLMLYIVTTVLMSGINIPFKY